MMDAAPEPPSSPPFSPETSSPTGWSCGNCHRPVAESASVCPHCRLLLNRRNRTRVPVSQPVSPIRPDPVKVAPVPGPVRDCPHCERPLHDVDARMCVRCLREVPPPAGTGVELRFHSGGVVRVQAGTEAVLGRHGTADCRRILSGQPQVGRRHAVLRVDEHGRVQVRDNGSLNGTFVNGEQISNDWRDLPTGSELRLGRTVCAIVRRPPAGTAATGPW